MIVCPSCGKENADNSVHCGFCGQQLQEGGKKTMFGMAALNSDQIRAAAEAAKAEAQAAAAATDAPVQVGEDAGVDANAKTEMMPSLGSLPPLSGLPPLGAPGNPEAAAAPAAEAPKPDPFADDFAALEAQFGDDPDFSDAPADAPTDTPPSDPVPSAASAPTPEQPRPAARPPVNAGAMTPAPSHELDEPAQKSNTGMIIGGIIALILLIAIVGGALAALGVFA